MNFTNFPATLSNRLRFHNERSWDKSDGDGWLSLPVRLVIQFESYATNAGNDLGLAFRFWVHEIGIEVSGVVWIDRSQAAPEADLQVEPVINLDEDNQRFIKNTALSIHRDVEEWLRP